MTSKKERFDKEYEFVSLSHINQEYKNWDFDFMLLTKNEKEEIMKNTYNRMKFYNEKSKPKSHAGYNNKNGETIH